MTNASQLTDIRKRLSRIEDLIKRQNLILQGKDPDSIITTKSLDAAIKSAYQYAHTHCKYGPTDQSFPPFANGNADCVGLALEALRILGVNTIPRNINMIVDLCEKAGLTKSTKISDVYKHHGIVLMCHKDDPNKNNIYHVYYSLGGDELTGISKYDLGSDERIRTIQPYKNVQPNEWTYKYEFKSIYYPT